MFELLVASRLPRATRGWTWSGIIAASAHALVIAGAVWGSSQAVGAKRPEVRGTSIPWFVAPPSPAEAGAAGPSWKIDAPAVPPADQMPDVPDGGWLPSLGPEFSSALRAPGAAPGFDSPSGVFGAPDEPPELLAAPLPAYPEPLRRAAVTGRVVIEAVIDTVGRAEAGTIRVVTSAHRMFEAAAREAVRRALFRPARAGGRAVRALVRVPVEFQLTRDAP